MFDWLKSLWELAKAVFYYWIDELIFKLVSQKSVAIHFTELHKISS